MSHHSGYETTLGAIAEQFDLELALGDPGARLDGVCALTPGRDAGLAFAESEAQADALAATGASAVILTAVLAPRCPAAFGVSPEYLGRDEAERGAFGVNDPVRLKGQAERRT